MGDRFHLTPPALCPECANPLTAAGGLTSPTARPPVAGDITVCIDCGEVLTYAEGLDVRHVRPAELLELEPADRLAISLFQQRVRTRGRLPRQGAEQ